MSPGLEKHLHHSNEKAARFIRIWKKQSKGKKPRQWKLRSPDPRLCRHSWWKDILFPVHIPSCPPGRVSQGPGAHVQAMRLTHPDSQEAGWKTQTTGYI